MFVAFPTAKPDATFPGNALVFAAADFLGATQCATTTLGLNEERNGHRTWKPSYVQDAHFILQLCKSNGKYSTLMSHELRKIP